MNRIILTLLMTIAVGLLVIPGGIIYLPQWLPFLIAFTVVIGVMTFVCLKNKAAEDASEREMYENLSNQLKSFHQLYDNQSHLCYSVVVGIPQLLENIVKNQGEVENKITELDNRFNQSIEAIRETAKIFKDESDSSKSAMVDALAAATTQMQETVESVRLIIENGQNTQIAELKALTTAFSVSLDKSTEGIKLTLDNQQEKTALHLATIKDDISASCETLSQALTKNVQSLNENLGSIHMSLEQGMQLQNDRMNAVMDTIPSSISEGMVVLKTTLIERGEAIVSEIGEVQKKLSTIKEDMIVSGEAVSQNFNAVIHSVQESVSDLQFSLEKGLQSQHDRMDSILVDIPSSFREGVEVLKTKVIECGDVLGSEVGGVRETLSTIKEEISKSSETLSNQLATTTQSVSENVAGLQSTLEKEMQSQTERIEAIPVSFSEGFDAVRTTLIEHSDGIVSEIGGIKEKLSDTNAAFRENLSSLGLNIDKSIVDLQESIYTEMKSQMDNVEKLSASMFSSVKAGFIRLNDFAEEQTEMIGEVARGIREDISQELRSQKSIQECVKQNIETTLAENSKNQIQCLNIINDIREAQTQLGENVANQKSVIEETVANVNGKIQDSFHGFTYSLKNTNENLVNELNRHFRELNGIMEDLPDTLQDAFRASVGSSIDEMGISILTLQQTIEGLDKYGEQLSRYEEQLNGLAKSETSIMNQFEKIITGSVRENHKSKR